MNARSAPGADAGRSAFVPRMDTEVQYVQGVGPKRAAEFAKLGVVTVADLVSYYPFRHELIPKSVAIDQLVEGQVATVVGELRNVRSSTSRSGPILSADVVDGTGRVRVRWFNSPFLSDKLGHGQVVRVTGKPDAEHGALAQFTNPRTEFLDETEGDPLLNEQDRFEAVYAATAKLPTREIRRIIDKVLDTAVATMDDPIPEGLRYRRRLPPKPASVLRLHRPTRVEDVQVARGRLAYEELLMCQVALQLSRSRGQAQAQAVPLPVTSKIDERARKRLPFKLTPGQEKAIAEITADLARTRPMNRLLQADVGAGKTAVAVYAALAAIANGRQVALLAPTEVLAAQLFQKVNQYLSGSRVRIEFLSGSSSKTAREKLLRGLRGGSVDWLIGTHAVLEKNVTFARLGLVIIDEQHKFGVAQRAKLRRKGDSPHVLVLTATPIPRTLAMTYFGDLDVSTIEGLPPGRRPVTTKLVPDNKVDEAWKFIRARLLAKEQAYIVYPLVEESDALPLKAASAEAAKLAKGFLAGCSVGLLHGRMKPEEKDAAMKQFRSGKLQALVSTTVIEVGVDVPGATVMAVQHAERFGLSQLHQLRGRVGRGTKSSYCFLFCDPKSEPAKARLKVLAETEDGFRIAEEDLRLRGPGELLGVRQHGLPAFRVADLVGDLPLLQNARDDAAALLQSDPTLSKPANRILKSEVVRRYGACLPLVDVA